MNGEAQHGDNAATDGASTDSTKLRNDFMRFMSHELRTPLTAIRGYSELLITERAGPLGEAQRRMITVIDLCAHRLHAVVEDLLVLSSIDCGAFGLAIEPVHVELLTARTLDDLQVPARDAHVTITTDIPVDLTVHADPRQLQRALTNLLTNAIRFSPRDGIIELTARLVDDTVRITILDHGSGVPPDEQRHLFERCFNAETQRTQHLESVGLGLAVVKAVIERHGGHVDISSNAGTGTAVSIVLPINIDGDNSGPNIVHVRR